MKAIREWIPALLGKERPAARELDLAREVQSLRLELAERNRQVADLKAAVERERKSETAHTRDTMRAQMEQLFTDVSAPVAQLYTQAYLVDVGGRPVPAKDVMVVVRRLLRALEDHGLTLEGGVGEIAPFDPDRHEPLSLEPIHAGQPVIQHFVSIAYQGRVLRKAGVEKAGG